MFELVADALRGSVPADLGQLHCAHHRTGIKVWLGADAKAPREHYEAQILGRQYVPASSAVAIEVGFHCEHPDEADNEAVIARLVGCERSWRKELGAEPMVGAFLGHAGHWRRVSEVWPDPDLSDPELIFDLAVRLAEYLMALEPCRISSRLAPWSAAATVEGARDGNMPERP